MRSRDGELRAGSEAHYVDPAYYESTYAERHEDVDYYVQVAAAGRGAVLELGIGNGRIALPVARTGREVYGLDSSAPMLADLKRKLAAEPSLRVRARRGDMRRFRFERKFRFIFAPFNTVLHLYSRGDVEQFLACVRAHLAPGGEFVCDLSMPLVADLARDPNELHRTPPFSHPTLGRVRYGERFDYDPVRQVLFVSMEFSSRTVDVCTPLAHRQFFPLEWEALLHYNGFRATALYGDFARGPLTAESDVMVWHCKARAR